MAEEIKRTSKYQLKLQARKSRAKRLGFGSRAIPTPILDAAEHGIEVSGDGKVQLIEGEVA